MSFLPKKIVSSFLILLTCSSLLYFILPAPQAHAQFFVSDPPTEFSTYLTDFTDTITTGSTFTTALTSVAGGGVKQYLLDTLATTLARLIIQGITAQTVNWINGGFQGNPGFVTNPQSFFTNIADYAVSSSLNTATGGLFNRLCSPFNLQVRLALINNYLYQNRIGQCTLGQMAANYTNWTNNFSNGGWNSWFTVTQNNQNNPYGSFLASQDELSIKVANQQGLKAGQLKTNAGILNFQSCVPSYTTQGGTGPTAAETQEANQAGQTGQDALAAINSGNEALGECILENPGGESSCEQQYGSQYDQSDTSESPSYTTSGASNNSQYAVTYTPPQQTCTTQTPGSLVNAQLEKVFGSGVDQLNVTTSINQIANALLSEAAKSIIGGVEGGLHNLTQPSSAGRPLATQLQIGSTESNTNQVQILASTTSQIPQQTQYAAGLSNTPPVSPPTSPSQQSVFSQTQQLQQQYCSTPGVTCATSTGSTSTSGLTGAALYAQLSSTYDCTNNPGSTVCQALASVQGGADPNQLYSQYDCTAQQPTEAATCDMLYTILNPSP